MLKFHERLVKTSGLPPTRLMAERDRLIGKNLSSKFEQIAGVRAEFGPNPHTGPLPDARTVPDIGTSSPSVAPPLMPGQIGVQPLTPPASTGWSDVIPTMGSTSSHLDYQLGVLADL